MRQSISSDDNPRVKKAIRLHTSRGRKQQNRILVFGYREIRRAIESGLAPDELFLCNEFLSADQLDWLSANVKSFPTIAFDLEAALFAKICFGDRVDGVVMTAIRPDKSLEHLQLSTGDSRQAPLIVVVESIEKPGNLGAIMRSADGAGVDGLMVANPLTDWFHPNAIRSSLGTAFSIPGAIDSSDNIQRWLAKNKFQTFIASLQTESSFYESDLTLPTAIVLGNEANGLGESWREGFKPVRIPMQGIADSLNVSVTAAVMLYEARRQRIAQA